LRVARLIIRRKQKANGASRGDAAKPARALDASDAHERRII
jgi:hypothetical protein